MEEEKGLPEQWGVEKQVQALASTWKRQVRKEVALLWQACGGWLQPTLRRSIGAMLLERGRAVAKEALCVPVRPGRACSLGWQHGYSALLFSMGVSYLVLVSFEIVSHLMKLAQNSVILLQSPKS